MRKSASIRLILALLVSWAGCTGDPQPFPIPHLELIRTTGLAENEIDLVEVVGEPGAVDGLGQIEVSGSLGHSSTTSTAEGSFVVSIKAKSGEVLEVRFGSSQPALISVLAPKLGPEAVSVGPDPGSTEPPISTPVAGMSTVHGIAMQGMILENLPILVVNFSNGHVVTTRSDANGLFTIQIDAQSGHRIHTYFVENPLSIPWIEIVP
jgi:hypothetical protein